MNTTRLFSVVVLLCYGCSSSSDSDYKKPERLSILIADSQVFDGMVSVMSGTKLTTLKAMSQVYVTDDSLGVNNANYVRVLWGDSAGYVSAERLLLNGRVGVLIPPESKEIEIYTDNELKSSSGNNLNDWNLAAVGRMNNTSAEIRYMNGPTPAIGYISPQSISLDTLDVAFFYTYKDAKKKYDGGDPAAMTELRENNLTFVSLPMYERMFPHMDEPSTDSEEESEAIFGATYNDDVPTGWFDEANQPIREEEWPAIIGAIAIFDDGSERVISLPNGLWSGRLGEDVSGPTVVKFRLTLSPKLKDNYTFEVISSNNWSEPDVKITRTFANAEPDKKYELVLEDGELSANLPCSHITIRVKVGNLIYSTQLMCDCPGM